LLEIKLVDQIIKKPKTYSKRKKSANKETSSYFDDIKEGPSIICFSCGGLWFKNNVRVLTDLQSEIIKSLERVHSKNFDKKFLCTTCRKAIAKGQVPKLCLLNGLNFPPIPEVH
jgi:hypothetical protein